MIRNASTAFIYALIDPFTEERRYIGKSIRPKERLMNHCNEKSKCYRTNWIQSVLSKGGRPRIENIEEVPIGSDWRQYEIFWISAAKMLGWPITNCTDGGDGVLGLSGESKERMLKTWKGRKHKPETLKKIGDATRGRKHTEEHKSRMREIMKNRIFSREHRERISEGTKKLTREDILTIRILLKNKVRLVDIAESFKVHRMTISKIKMGHSYGDIR